MCPFVSNHLCYLQACQYISQVHAPATELHCHAQPSLEACSCQSLPFEHRVILLGRCGPASGQLRLPLPGARQRTCLQPLRTAGTAAAAGPAGLRGAQHVLHNLGRQVLQHRLLGAPQDEGQHLGSLRVSCWRCTGHMLGTGWAAGMQWGWEQGPESSQAHLQGRGTHH